MFIDLNWQEPPLLLQLFVVGFFMVFRGFPFRTTRFSSQVYWCLHIFYGLRAEIFWRMPGALA